MKSCKSHEIGKLIVSQFKSETMRISDQFPLFTELFLDTVAIPHNAYFSSPLPKNSSIIHKFIKYSEWQWVYLCLGVYRLD